MPIYNKYIAQLYTQNFLPKWLLRMTMNHCEKSVNVTLLYLQFNVSSMASENYYLRLGDS